MQIKIKNNLFNVRHSNNFFLNVFGLMFQIINNDGLLMEFSREKYIALHTFFVFHKLDLVYINKDLSVIKIRKNILPFTFYIPHVKCKYILELKNSKNIKVDDKMIIKS